MKFLLSLFTAAILPFMVSARIGDERYSERLKALLRDDMTHHERMMVIKKFTWPECVTEHLTSIECKELIDYDILTLNTGVDVTMRSVIIPKRAEDQMWYNSVVIPLEDNDLVAGRDNNGIIYYDFVWHSTGFPATEEHDAYIPMVEVDPETLQTVHVSGASLEGVLAGTDSRPIAGGNYDPSAQSTIVGQEKLAKALEAESVVEEGDRILGPWDCSGMTGIDCCLMIKHEVRDIDHQNNAIQCYLDYKPGTLKYYEQQYASRVRIFETHDGHVAETPVVG
mmetsp:Transcript_19641/g.38850  ORF Transcript_19641/g.38850 Transcript_19641/m.38850 type:complete len:281 (+) Transcript_19641:184-1026(+)